MAFSYWFFLLVLAAGALAPNPIGVPPLPEDPRLLGCAPAETLVYVQWFGTAEANPKSPNRTERAAADPEVRRFVAAILDTFGSAAGQGAAAGARMAQWLAIGTTLLRRPGCAFLVPDAQSPVGLGYGVVVNVGEDVAQIAERARALIPSETRSDERKTLEGVEFHLLEAGGVLTGTTVHGEHLGFAFGPVAMGAIAAGFGSAPGLAANPRFAAAHGKVAVARPSIRTFADFGALLELRAGGDTALLLRALELTANAAYCAESGLEADGYVSRALLAVDERHGLLGAFDGEPLDAAALGLVPADAIVAGVARFDLDRAYGLALDALRALDPRDAGRAEAQVEGAVEELFGLDLRDDLLAHLGDEWAVWSSPREGGSLVIGACACVTLDDPDAFAAALERIVARLREMLPQDEPDRSPRPRDSVTLAVEEHAGTRIHFVDWTSGPALAPAFCVHDGKLWIATYPEVLKAAITRPDDLKTLADVTELPPGARVHVRLDARSLVATFYTALLGLGRAAAAELRQAGLRVDAGAVPTLPVLQGFLDTETTTLELDAAGLFLTSRGTIPRFDPGLGALFALFGTFGLFRF